MAWSGFCFSHSRRGVNPGFGSWISGRGVFELCGKLWCDGRIVNAFSRVEADGMDVGKGRFGNHRLFSLIMAGW
jgi:hypothetical protein